MKTISENHSEYICDISAPCFQALAPEEMEVIQTSKTQVQFRRGDNLAKQDTFASYILFVAKGLAVQYIEGDGNKNFNLKIIQPGEFVGLSSVFSDKTFNYSAAALSDCQALLVEKSAIANIIERNGNFGIRLMQRYTEQRMNLFDTLRKVLYKQMLGKIAEALLYINTFKKAFPDIFTLLSRKQLADFAGITTESLVKALKLMEKEEIISLEGKDIELKKIDYLEDISIRG
jgi:CRP/FNR family transcriptional regulator